MRRSFRNLWKLAALGVAIASPLGSPSGAATGSAPQADMGRANAELAAVRARIAELANRRAAELADSDALSAKLRRADLDIAGKRSDWEAVRAAELAGAKQRALLRERRTQYTAARARARLVLAGQVRAAYMIGRQAQIKMLLLQPDAASAGRMQTYYGYFARECAAQVDAISRAQQGLLAVIQDLDRQSARLAALADADRSELLDLERARKERRVALAALAAQVDSHGRELAKLKRQEQSVEALLADLARALSDYPADDRQGFDGLQGRMAWPVSGHFSARARDQQNGVLIDAAPGSRVRAAYYGRVVYADWLQGLGLLLIVAHGGGYMSLYGHAEVLYKSVGDSVAPGDVIAALSDAEGAAPQLYFEIRQGRKPLDAKRWLKSNP